MEKIKFVKDHPSRRFKKNDVVEVPTQSVKVWEDSGYAVALNKVVEEDEGNVETSTEVGGDSKTNAGQQSKFGKGKNRKKNRKK